MHDAGKVLIGLLIFLVLITFPIWYNFASGKAGYAPTLEKAAMGEDCVRDSAWMTGHHMDLLNEWRNQVVRDGQRFETLANGMVVERSLSNTCLSCHQSKEQFCDQCHTYLGVEPYCWECHIIPEEINQ
ncbi:cytochrome C [candidate division GN15 bacterium]|nr:cytochrome C [candidate division GN15 bacterium]